MEQNYLIIFDRYNDGNETHYWLADEDELLNEIRKCKKLGWNINFAGKIAVVQEFIG
jgi:hypothetical protein